MQPPSWSRVRLTDVNPYLVCVLCRGYYIDATTIVECLHSFCRSCITTFLQSNSFCPICDVQIHKAQPFRNIKPDKALQNIVYKLVPGLYHCEMARRRAFYSKHPTYAAKTTPEDRGEGLERMIYAPDESISLSLEYNDVDRERDEWESISVSSNNSEAPEAFCIRKRYLLCPALVTIGVLKRFLRGKYDLSPAHKVEIFHKRESLSDDLSLMDVAYIYTWKQNGPIQFQYRFCEIPTVAEPNPQPLKDEEKSAEASQKSSLTFVLTPDPIATKVPAPIVSTDLITTATPSTSSVVSGELEVSSSTAGPMLVPQETRPQNNVGLPEAPSSSNGSDAQPVFNGLNKKEVLQSAIASSRISIGLLASLALERRHHPVSIAPVARKRTSQELKHQEKRPRLVPKFTPPLPALTSITPISVASRGLMSITTNKISVSTEPNLSKVSGQNSALIVDKTKKASGSTIPDTLSITPVVVSKKEPQDDEKKIGVGLSAKVLPTATAAVKRPFEDARSPPPKTFNGKASSIPRLIEIAELAKKPCLAARRGGKRSESQRHDGIGALDLSSSSRRQRPHATNILGIAQNLARRQQQLLTTTGSRQTPAPSPAPPLSPLSALSAFPVTSFMPVRSPPPPPLRIPVPPTNNANFRLQPPPQQRPSSLSSASPSPPADSGSSSSRSPRVPGTPTHDLFPPQSHLLPPPPPPSSFMFRSRFELQNPWHGEWYNEHLMQCLERLRRGGGLPPSPYFPTKTSTSRK